ncbi:hypothetical protein A6B35_30830 (plasmid) [Mesorhizobium amorphae CCNWGS0123]|nr:hypothetical protein A6B35_30830 [Mesorhizobium amorphae CCNWGS0123]
MQGGIQLFLRDCVLAALSRDIIGTPPSCSCIQVGHGLPTGWAPICLRASGGLIAAPGLAVGMPGAFFWGWRVILQQPGRWTTTPNRTRQSPRDHRGGN